MIAFVLIQISGKIPNLSTLNLSTIQLLRQIPRRIRFPHFYQILRSALKDEIPAVFAAFFMVLELQFTLSNAGIFDYCKIALYF